MKSHFPILFVHAYVNYGAKLYGVDASERIGKPKAQKAPDRLQVLVYAQHYVDPMRLLDPLDRRGWLRFADQRAGYYQAHELPPQFMYDYTSDYLPPQPALPPYARDQNEAMKKFAAAWNDHFASQPERQIHPPEISFTTAEVFLDEFTKQPLDITTLRGDWPSAWTYYDEPSNTRSSPLLANNRPRRPANRCPPGNRS